MATSRTNRILYKWQIQSPSQNRVELQKTDGIIENVKKIFSFQEYTM